MSPVSAARPIIDQVAACQRARPAIPTALTNAITGAMSVCTGAVSVPPQISESSTPPGAARTTRSSRPTVMPNAITAASNAMATRVPSLWNSRSTANATGTASTPKLDTSVASVSSSRGACAVPSAMSVCRPCVVCWAIETRSITTASPTTDAANLIASVGRRIRSGCAGSSTGTPPAAPCLGRTAPPRVCVTPYRRPDRPSS
ncbi:hypothetical protein [Actinomadura madurae]|uniref:hypothetical protein n=1 Tax=Actinomadura madurae TaxID=1993 RepID=UPI0020D1FD0C|nr:hypothetical protein [Actinomadura madurae]MCP9976775.1 hypothetical protein [Actinomadura madurae]